jgi:hypothetical protein
MLTKLFRVTRQSETCGDENYHGRAHFGADTPETGILGTILENYYENINILVSVSSKST